MSLTRKEVWQPVALGLAVLVAGTGVMSIISRVGVPPEVPNWQDFGATTIGDTLLLPLISGCLFAAWLLLRPLAGTAALWPFIGGGIIGLLGGAAVQASWLMDPNPRLTWVLLVPHRFSWHGWYHAIFLMSVSCLILALATAVLAQLWSLRRIHASAVLQKAATSPLTIVILASTWVFLYLIVRDGGQGSSLSATVAAVALPVVCVTFLTLVTLGRSSLPGLILASIAAVTSAACIALFEARLLQIFAVVMAGAVAVGVALRDNQWRSRLGEYCLVGLVVAAETLIAIDLSVGQALTALLICAIGIPMSVIIVTRLLQPWTVNAASFQAWPSVAVGALTTMLPVAAWLQAEPEAAQVVGNFAIAGYSVLLMPQLAPVLVEKDTQQLLARERADAGVTAAPPISEVASRVFIRAAAWGVAAVCGILTVVVAAGPSMGFDDGQGVPSFDAQYLALELALALLAVVLTRLAQHRRWGPAIPLTVSVALCWLSVPQLAGTQQNPQLIFLLPLALAFLWQLESVLGNAAMRPSWVVRRAWRLPLGIAVAAATATNIAVAMKNGTYGAGGEPVPILLSFVLLCAAMAVNLLLVIAAGRSLDWRNAVGAHHSASTVPNWARYRLRNILLMDFGLMQLVVLLGIWLPVAALARVDPETAWSWVGAIMLACTGMLFFSQIFFLSLRNSVAHVDEQSFKAGRSHDAWLLGSLPRVSAGEERATLKAMILDREGPLTQLEWARFIAVHQLHVNILALLIVFISLVGILPFANNLRSR